MLTKQKSRHHPSSALSTTVNLSAMSTGVATVSLQYSLSVSSKSIEKHTNSLPSDSPVDPSLVRQVTTDGRVQTALSYPLPSVNATSSTQYYSTLSATIKRATFDLGEDLTLWRDVVADEEKLRVGTLVKDAAEDSDEDGQDDEGES